MTSNYSSNRERYSRAVIDEMFGKQDSPQEKHDQNQNIKSRLEL
jgi:hypothetical protein